MMRVVAFAAVWALLAVGRALAADIPSPSPKPFPPPEIATRGEPVVEALRVGSASLKIDRVTLDEAVAALGKAAVQRNRGALAVVCYRVEASQAQLILMSYGGDDPDIMNWVSLYSPDEGPNDCTPLKGGEPSFDGWLKLGLTREAIVARLGAPSVETQDNLNWSSWSITSGHGSDGRFMEIEDAGSLSVSLKEGRAIAIEVVRTHTMTQ